jgi:hypothetical protein
MDDLDDFRLFLGAAGRLYGKKNLSPPFRLNEFAAAWRSEGIPLSHCLDQIKRHLDENSSQYRCGSGDGGLVWLDQVVRRSWRRLNRPPRALPERTDRLFKRNIAFDDDDARFVDPTDSVLRTADVPSHPSRMRPSPRSASDPANTAPNPIDPIGLKPIDKAEALLRRELANGEVPAAVIEQYARDDGISPRTLDRARRRLMVISRRTGFGKTGRSWLSLPKAP